MKKRLCTFAFRRAYTLRKEVDLDSERFVRVPTSLLEALLRARLTGTQWRIVFWVIRNTHGWNRQSTSFTWYRIAQELGMDRAAVYRSGQSLLAVGILALRERELAVQVDTALWMGGVPNPTIVAARQLWMPAVNVARQQRSTLPPRSGGVAPTQRQRCHGAALFRRAKDSSKDKVKTSIQPQFLGTGTQMVRGAMNKWTRQPSAGAAQPVPGKYDRVSQD